MSNQTPECFSFTLRRRPFEAGISIVYGANRGWRIAIGPREKAHPVFFEPGHFDTCDFRKPILTQGGRVVRDSSKGYGEFRLRRRASHDGVLLRVIAAALDFGVPPLAKGLDFNAGGEGRPALLQYGKCKDTAKDQLFQLRNGEFIYVVDRNTAVMKVRCIDDVLRMEPVDVPEIIDYVFNCGCRSEYVGGKVWAYCNLQKLGASPNLLDQLARQVPNFRIP